MSNFEKKESFKDTSFEHLQKSFEENKNSIIYDSPYTEYSKFSITLIGNILWYYKYINND